MRLFIFMTLVLGGCAATTDDSEDEVIGFVDSAQLANQKANLQGRFKVVQHAELREVSLSQDGSLTASLVYDNTTYAGVRGAWTVDPSRTGASPNGTLSVVLVGEGLPVEVRSMRFAMPAQVGATMISLRESSGAPILLKRMAQ